MTLLFSSSPRLFRPFLRVFALVASFVLLWPALAVAADAPPSPIVALTGRRVLILGDSITQDGRYVSFLEYALRRLAPDATCDLISVGLSAETVSGLSERSHPFPRPCVIERLDRALTAVKPDVVLACYGMNDGVYAPPSPERLAAFQRGLRQLIAAVRAHGLPLVLITPPVFDPAPIRARLAPPDAVAFGYDHPYSNYDHVLAEFARVENSLHEAGVTLVDLHTTMAAALAARRQSDPAFSFTADGVHPGDAGHAFIARTLLTALGYPDEPLTPPPALFSLIDDRRRLRSEAWLPFIGYERDGHFKSGSVAATEKAAARLEAGLRSAYAPKNLP